ncbi:hypothetical protein K9M42_03430 [Patescibacteria group bacterium]|nr:hypothetical protein [Patescibacteria group bacterium]
MIDIQKFKKQCMGIVNQLFDLAEVPVKKRQAINDEADEYVQDQVFRMLSDGISEFYVKKIKKQLK